MNDNTKKWKKKTKGNKVPKEQYKEGNNPRFDTKRDNPIADARKSSPNNWQWYAANEQLLRDTASLPFTWPLGNKISLGEYGLDANKTSLPGIAAINVAMTYGYADNQNSPINVAARNIYSYVRHANSGHANYDAPDLMIYLAAMDQAYAFLSWIKRLYGIIQTYNEQNRFYPIAMLAANGIEYEGLVSRLSDFRAYINNYAVKIGSLCVPSSMSYMLKHMWLYEGAYLDKPLAKAQTYMFVPADFYYFDRASEEPLLLAEDDEPIYGGAGLLRSVTHNIFELTDGDLSGSGPLDFDMIREIGNMIIDPILASEDMNIMSGDILKAFTPNGIYQVSGIAETYTVLPAYDSTVLDQIQNLNMMGHIQWPEDDIVLYQAASQVEPYLPNGRLESKPLFKHPYGIVGEADSGANAWLVKRFLTLENDNPTPAQVMEATRMSNIATSFDGETDTFLVETLGSEVATTMRLWYFSVDAGGYSWLLQHSQDIFVGLTTQLEFSSVTPPEQTDVERWLRLIRMDYLTMQQLSQFTRHPMVAFTSSFTDEEDDTIYFGPINGHFFEIDNYAIVDKDNLKIMSEVALLSQFNVTQFGRVSQ